METIAREQFLVSPVIRYPISVKYKNKDLAKAVFSTFSKVFNLLLNDFLPSFFLILHFIDLLSCKGELGNHIFFCGEAIEGIVFG